MRSSDRIPPRDPVCVCLPGLHKHTSQEPQPDFVDAKPKQSCLVPTPLVVASSSPGSDRTLSYKPHFTPPSNKPDLRQKPVAPRVPPEANVAMPPPVKPRDHSVRKAEGPPGGPLSYEALVHLRRSASAKKTPLCPTLDHTVDLDRRLPVTAGGPNLGHPPRSDGSHPEACRSKTGPPVVGPKPKRIPASMSVRRRDEASVTADPPLGTKNATDPQGVRLEALQKLGLLKDREPGKESVAPVPAAKPHFSLDPMPNRFTRGPPHVNPSRSPSSCHSQGPKNKPLQSSASFHHDSRSDQQSASSDPAPSNGTRATGLERSVTLDNHRNGQPAPRKPENPVGYTVMVAPGMGADRKEALRKLGLLRD